VDGGHTERDGEWLDYEQIPRRPERPKSYEAYLYPLADAPVVSGYDLDRPDQEQRRGRMQAVGHGGVDLVAKIGTPITTVRLEHQLGEAEVLYVGPLYGETVVTRHVVRESGVDRDYVLLFGHLDHAADDVRRGQRLREGATVGFVGNSASPEFVHLHLEARRMRDGKDAWRVPGALLDAREYSVVTDPRNVLPLRDQRMRTPRCVPRLASEPRRYWLGDAWTLRLE
jgi:murein DD-endopeptidase MepM/ murein hydrolase activator NlpD